MEQQDDRLWQTEYGVQPFGVEKRKLVAREARPARTADLARRLGERLAARHAGVLVFERRSAPALGEYEPVRVLAAHGTLPAALLDEIRH